MSYDFIIKPPETESDWYEHNVTYNLSSMLKRAGFHPRVVGGLTVDVLRPVVLNAYELMLDNRNYFEQFNPPIDPNTGKTWGSYEVAVRFLQSLNAYLESAPDNFVMRVV